MRVTFISPFPIFPPHGGNRARTLTLITYLREMGHQISFVLLNSRQLGDYEEAPHQLFFGESNFIFLGRNPLWNFFYYLLRAYKIMMRFLKKHLGLKNFNLRSVDENYYRPFTRQIETISKQLNADIVVVEYVQFSRAFDAFKEGASALCDILAEAENESLAAPTPAPAATNDQEDLEAPLGRNPYGMPYLVDGAAVVRHMRGES